MIITTNEQVLTVKKADRAADTGLYRIRLTCEGGRSSSSYLLLSSSTIHIWHTIIQRIFNENNVSLNIVFKRTFTFSFEATGFVNVLDVPSKPRLLKPDEVIFWTFEDGTLYKNK